MGMTCRKWCATKEERTKQDYLLFSTLKNRVCLVNTYFGFENVCALPPNIYLTGPLVEESSTLLDNLTHKSPNVTKFMDDALQNGQKVLVISMGSIIVWQQWGIDHIIEGVKKLAEKMPIRVLWSLKEDV